ncbi:MAG: MMPL family transporter [Planctomycetia bacterium]|nr:MMPL family transporter [Planctomycetia bacterium]
MEGQSSADQLFLARPFVFGTRLILAYPVATIAIALGLAAAACYLTGTLLGYQTSRLDLLNPKSNYNRLWIEYIKEFGDEDDAVVVVEGKGREQVVPVLEELSAALAREDRLFHAVLHEVDLGKIRSKGLHYLSPEELLGVDQFLTELSPILAGDWSPLNLGNMAGGMCQQLEVAARGDPRGVAETRDKLQRLSSSLSESLGQRRRYQSPWPEMPSSFAILSELNSEYLLTKQGQLGFVLLRLARGEDSFNHCTEATDALRALIAQTQTRHPDTKIGLTGLPIMENDEMRSSQTSMFWASLVSMVGVALLFVAGFGGVRHALLANLILLVGMAWAFGYVTLTVGHLNILSVSFTVTLIGIGIDYGVYYVARYLQLRGDNLNCEDALLETARGAGPAITTGAITTAISFFAAGFTSFKGVAELGIIAGGGLLLCAVSELVLLPAIIYLVDRSGWGVRMPRPLAVHAWIAPLLKVPRLTLAVTLAFTAVASAGLGRLWYDNNLLNMQAEGLESVALEKKLLAECNQSVWYALSIADSREELLARKAEFLKLDSVERTEEIVSLLPVDDQVKQPIIARIQHRLSALTERPPLITVDKPERLGQVFGCVQDLLSRGRVDEKCSRQLEVVRDQLRRMPPEDCYAQLSRFQQEMAGDLLSRLHILKSIANPEPPTLTDLPASLVDRFVGQHGKYLLKIYGRGDIWDTNALGHFVKEVRTVDPQVTGNPLQAHEASLEMKQSYQEAAIYSLLVILGVLVLDFKSVHYAILAALPLGVGVLQMFGLLGVLDIPLNPANLIALPLILGIGVDYGVHIVHEFRESQGPYKMSPGTAVAVLVDALTTLVGFGSLMIASHQGLQSLGRVLTLGVTCCLFTSLIMLPALLTYLTRNRQMPEATEPLLPLEIPPAVPQRVIPRRVAA